MVLIARSISKVFYRKNSFITTPIFYVNAAPHLGHLYTSVLADASHRWEKLKEPNGKHIFSTGTDEHGIKIYRAAETAKQDPQSFCDQISGKFKYLFEEFDVEFTNYIRTTDAHHKIAVQHMWEKLQKGGFIYKDVYKGWYSVVDECFYQDSEVEDGEVKGKKVKVVKGTQTIVDFVEEDNYMFRLQKDEVRKWLTENDVIRPRHYLPFILKFLDMDEDLSISRCRKRLPWGIPVPGDDDQTIYVWLDALVNYLSVLGYPTQTNEMIENWPPSCQIIGKDIMKFHALYWPSFLIATQLPLPKRLFVHGHWLVDNTKMSKSLGNVVDPFDAKKTYSSEGLRYFLLKQGVPHEDSSFTALKAKQVINSDLVNNIGNLLSRATVPRLNADQIYPGFEVAALNDASKKVAEPLIDSLNTIRDETKCLYDDMLFYKAIEGLMTVVKQGNLLFQTGQPWKLQPGEELSSLLNLAYETVRVSSILLHPVVPRFTAHALDRLGTSSSSRSLKSATFNGGNIIGNSMGEEKGPYLQRLQ